MKIENMNLKVFRESISAGDDASFHGLEFDFEINSKLKNTIQLIEEHEEYKNYGGGIWAGLEKNFKRIRTNSGKWIIDEKITLEEFFKDIKPFIRFERNSKRCIG